MTESNLLTLSYLSVSAESGADSKVQFISGGQNILRLISQTELSVQSGLIIFPAATTVSLLCWLCIISAQLHYNQSLAGRPLCQHTYNSCKPELEEN